MASFSPSVVPDPTISRPARIDTDQFGTFTGDVPRTRTARDAALDKALLGVLLTGNPYSLASEATYRNEFGMTQLDELLLFHDAERGVTLTESIRAAVPPTVGTIVTSPGEALRVARRHGFPEAGLVATAESPGGPVIRKGQRHAAQLAVTVSDLLTRADEVRLEPIEALLPRGAGVLGPRGDLHERFGTQAAGPAPPLPSTADQAGLLEDLQVP